jgi:tRNA pseudouridine38-40 synthase
VVKYKLIISYDGTDFGGWQVQHNSVSIQHLIQEALQTILRTPTLLTGASRTDAGVHALGQVAHFSVENEIDPQKLLASLNGLLPATIRIHAVACVDPAFHARYDALGKIYHYHLSLQRTLPPFKRLYTTQVLYPLDFALMQQASKQFVGTHDFTSFANEGGAALTKTRTLHRLDLFHEPAEGDVRLEFEGDGFLYKMVRNIVGTLLDVGRGHINLEELPSIFAAKDRKRAGISAPPQGLFLVKVHYSSLQRGESKSVCVE